MEALGGNKEVEPVTGGSYFITSEAAGQEPLLCGRKARVAPMISMDMEIQLHFLRQERACKILLSYCLFQSFLIYVGGLM